LVEEPNSRGENILLFLAQRVGRQQVEQRQHRPSRSRKAAARKTAVTAGSSEANEPDMPEHDLDPPKFARKALDRLLNDWNTVKAMVMTGHKETTHDAVYEDQAFLSSQSGTALLDKFTHCLLVKNSADMLDTLLNTLIRQLKMQTEAKMVAKRFVRSVIRVFVVFNVELAPGHGKKKSLHHSSSSQPLQKCKRVFQVINNLPVITVGKFAIFVSTVLPVKMLPVTPVN
jgi:E3 ubiquitin-protein ligase EDD1